METPFPVPPFLQSGVPRPQRVLFFCGNACSQAGKIVFDIILDLLQDVFSHSLCILTVFDNLLLFIITMFTCFNSSSFSSSVFNNE